MILLLIFADRQVANESCTTIIE